MNRVERPRSRARESARRPRGSSPTALTSETRWPRRADWTEKFRTAPPRYSEAPIRSQRISPMAIRRIGSAGNRSLTVAAPPGPAILAGAPPGEVFAGPLQVQVFAGPVDGAGDALVFQLQ